MAGLFNNETGQYEPADWLEAADWFVDAAGALYLVLLPDVTAECAGPDNETVDGINAACRDHGRLTEADAERLGLNRVPDVLKRFDPRLGYYHA
jgi:hypothetical protein